MKRGSTTAVGGELSVSVAVVDGRDVKLHGLADPVITLAEVEAGGDALTADDMRLALELTPHEKREMWGVSSPEP